MDLEKEILEIKERNKRVETDKAWEVSWTRRLAIMAMTYIIAAAWLEIIHEPHLWWKAFVPAAGYLLSTFSLPVIKDWWAS